MALKYKKESYIRQDFENGKWSFTVRPPQGNQKRFSENKYGSPRRAYDEAVRYRNECLNGLVAHKNNQNITLLEVLNESFELFPLRASTKRKTLLLANKYIDSMDVAICKIVKTDVMKSLNAMVADCSDDTIQRVLHIWRRAYKTALVKDYLQIDVTQGVIAPKSIRLPKEKKKVVTDRETLNLVEEKVKEKYCAKESDSIIMALELMWYTGLRPCECFALTINDIKDGYISVTKELGTDLAISDDVLLRDDVIRTCKTHASIRQIPIPKELQIKLSEYKPLGKILFPTKHGGYFNVNNLGNTFNRFKLGFNMYQLRHTLATRLIVEKQADERSVMEILGHESFNMSLYYSRSNDDKKRKLLENL